MITFFKDENRISENRYKLHKELSTILKTCDTFVINAATSSSVTLSMTGFGLVVVPISFGIACALTLAKKV